MNDATKPKPLVLELAFDDIETMEKVLAAMKEIPGLKLDGCGAHQLHNHETILSRGRYALKHENGNFPSIGPGDG